MSRRQAFAADYLAAVEETIRFCDSAGIAVLPSRYRKKGSFVQGWPDLTKEEALDKTQAELSKGPINLAGRTGEGWAVLDLDAKSGVDPQKLLPVLLQLLGDSVMGVVRTGRGLHIWIRVAESVGNGYCSYLGGEVFSESHLAMLPPSVHPAGPSYTWLDGPRLPRDAADLRAVGLVPDEASSHQSGAIRSRKGSKLTQASPEIQAEFERLMASTGIRRTGQGSHDLVRCGWHADRSPSLSVDWSAAVFCCFSPSCGVRGGLRALRHLVEPNTPTYRQYGSGRYSQKWDGEEDQTTGDNLGCSIDVDAEVARTAEALERLGLSKRSSSLKDCRQFFRVGTCTGCGRRPAFPISCGDPLCLRCMPGRLSADWQRHEAAIPRQMHLLRLIPT